MKSLQRVPFIAFLLLLYVQPAHSQIDRINETISQQSAEAHLRLLASDEMRGRNTGTVELNIAGRYIAEQFRKFGLESLGDQEEDYLQKVPLFAATAPSIATVSIGEKEFKFGKDLALINGVNGSIDAPLVLVENVQELRTYDLQDKVAVIILQDLMAAFRNQDRVTQLKDLGARGLIEIFSSGHQYPWPLVMQSLNRQKISIGELESKDEKDTFSHVWIRDSSKTTILHIREAAGAAVSLTIEGLDKKAINTFNVVGKVSGTDTDLSKEHIVMCAHYDHVGVQSGPGVDSIYNGTRDNGIGTTGVLNAAEYFSKYPVKRSIIFIALTGEEKGLLGSRYYADHPKVPLEETVFTLNIDNSGYTDTEVITLLDTGRTNIDALVYQAASELGLGVIGDRIPAQNYYERSDQVSFASKGVPAVNFKMSMVAFDERISKYYHQPADQVDNVDLDYIYKYWRAYIRSAELIGNWGERPYWIPGDKFEAAGKELYNE